ncbi:twin-arginine translocase TatA/TatE family subunit [Anaeromyxobacter diazotrophicus]|nr:twin-arginine translocase TatA/TatE family subunit [Anaeromyxobacter diazotrophicus]
MGEMLVVLVIALLVFGPTKVPQLGESLGKGIRNFKKAVNEPEAESVPVPVAPQPQLAPSAAVSQAAPPATVRPTEDA